MTDQGIRLELEVDCYCKMALEYNSIYIDGIYTPFHFGYIISEDVKYVGEVLAMKKYIRSIVITSSRSMSSVELFGEVGRISMSTFINDTDHNVDWSAFIRKPDFVKMYGRTLKYKMEGF